MPEADDVHLLDVVHVARPHHRVYARIQSEQTVLKARQPSRVEWDATLNLRERLQSHSLQLTEPLRSAV